MRTESRLRGRKSHRGGKRTGRRRRNTGFSPKRRATTRSQPRRRAGRSRIPVGIGILAVCALLVAGLVGAVALFGGSRLAGELSAASAESPGKVLGLSRGSGQPASVSADPTPSAQLAENGAKAQPALPLWRQNAALTQIPDDTPIIAIVLDDVGVAPAHAELAINLPPEITLSLMTYAAEVASLADRASAKGHELMLHFPMEPLDSGIDPGPNALLVGLDRGEMLRRLDWGLSRFTGYIGVNNHMGSRFTLDPAGMRVVLEMLREHDLLFLDSRTSPDSVGAALAKEMGVTYTTRDVFLDNEMSSAMVWRKLREAERIALDKGAAVAIGHPHPSTIEALWQWIGDAKARGFAIVPLSTVVLRQSGASG